MVEANRPAVTFALFAYNQEKYVGEAIAGAFAQTYSPLEIILSDDNSSDKTFEIMRSAAAEYKGPHCVVLNRNPHNLNIGAHVSAVARLAKGDLIVMAAGDDLSLPGRTEKLVRHWESLGRPPAVLYSGFECMNANSKAVPLTREAIYRGEHSIAAMARGEIYALGATAAVSRDVFAAFLPIEPTVIHEDRVLPFRALLLGGTVALVDEKLVHYRIEGGVSRKKVQSAHDYLFDHVPTLSARTLPDARQRLSDLDAVAPGNLRLRRLCLAAIAGHLARIELTRARGLNIELAFLKWLKKGAQPNALLRLYLKLRFYSIFDRYYRRKCRSAS